VKQVLLDGLCAKCHWVEGHIQLQRITQLMLATTRGASPQAIDI
jgi:hypothetical protein